MILDINQDSRRLSVFKAAIVLKYFWNVPGPPGHIIPLTVAYNFIILHFDNFLACL